MSRLLRRPLNQTTAFIVAMLTIVSCTKQSATKDEARSEGAVATASKAHEINLAIWANYLAPATQEAFTKKTGIKINVSNYSSNEELLAKIQAGASGIDMAVPSDYMVDILIKTKALEALDKSKIPNKENLEAMVLGKSYDPQNLYSLPFAWTTTGLAINRDLYKGKITSWKDLFTNKDLAGKISLLDDVREATGAALKLHGYSINTTNPAEIDVAKASLLELRPRIKMFQSDTVDLLVNQEVVVAEAYSSDALIAQSRAKAHIDYILPEEGGIWAIDNLVILKGSPHAQDCLELINFLLSPENNVMFVKTNFGGPVLKTTRAQLPPQLRDQKSLFPPAAVQAKFELLKDLGEGNRLYDRLWTEVKAR